MNPHFEFSRLSVLKRVPHMQPGHIYIHYPYCLYKCHYCDFNSYAYERKDIPQDGYTQALLAEITARRDLYRQSGKSFFPDGTVIHSIFFGGGTPSLMVPEHVGKVLQTLAGIFNFADDVEITLECNPGTVTVERLRAFRAAGITRLSLGVQSLHDKYLKNFGRIHTGDEALQALSAAQAAGISRISCDLIYGFPGQTLAEWDTDLDRILAHSLSHLSCYALTAEEGTLFTQDVRKGKVSETDADTFSKFQEHTYQRLNNQGMVPYEISNFATPGAESCHNLAYWRYRSYVGLGAGAFSNFAGATGTDKIFTRREMNHKAPEHYLRKVNEGKDFSTTEDIDRKTAMREFIMMGLRLKEGVSEERFKNLFSVTLQSEFANAIHKNVTAGRLIYEAGILRPTQSGFLMNNAVVAEFFS